MSRPTINFHSSDRPNKFVQNLTSAAGVESNAPSEDVTTESVAYPITQKTVPPQAISLHASAAGSVCAAHVTPSGDVATAVSF
jgi:hypothetical protein